MSNHSPVHLSECIFPIETCRHQIEEIVIRITQIALVASYLTKRSENNEIHSDLYVLYTRYVALSNL